MKRLEAERQAAAEVASFLKEGYHLVHFSNAPRIYKLHHRKNTNTIIVRVFSNCWTVKKNGELVKLEA